MPAAKALALYLTLNIVTFEANNGAVNVPLATLQPDIGHLSDHGIADLIAEAVRIRNAKPIEPAPSATARPN